MPGKEFSRKSGPRFWTRRIRTILGLTEISLELVFSSNLHKDSFSEPTAKEHKEITHYDNKVLPDKITGFIKRLATCNSMTPLEREEYETQGGLSLNEDWNAPSDNQ